ncbi:MAG: EFR1 family ferrodoxin [Bacteroidaceae bacterium]|nr:EFR1 family ferrodoxin [Bacteroidaceae bacterium]
MIYYFSATGNSRHVAERIAAALGDIARSIEQVSHEVALKEGEVLGIVSPANWNELPVLVREFIQKTTFTLSGNNYVFTVATFGMMQGFVCEDARREFKKKGVTMDAGFSVLMPDNWTPIFDLSDPVKVQRTVDAAEPQIDDIIKMINRRVKGNRSHRRMPYFLRAITDRLLHYERQTRFFSVDESLCVGCGSCARKCPVAAIEMQDKHPVWTKERCAICLGCLHRCPKFAIQYDGKTQNHGQYQHSKYWKRQ